MYGAIPVTGRKEGRPQPQRRVLWAAPRETHPQSRASQWLSKGKTTRKSLDCSFFSSRPSEEGL